MARIDLRARLDPDPVLDERGLFEKLALETFASGLSWRTILAKRDAFRAAFAGFHPDAVASFGDADVERLLADPGIVRNRAKIEATLANARVTVGLRATGEPLEVAGDGFVAWSEGDIERFEATFPAGTKPRLALALLLYTAQRRSDVIRMGRQHVRGGLISVRQQKTGAYLDQRDNQRLVADLAARVGGPVLDLGCHVGGFALHAAARGLDAVGLDQSARALEFARGNAARNDLSSRTAWV